MQKPILVIDDDPIIQTLLKRTLTQSGYEVIVASRGDEGIAKAQQIIPAMIICDWLMPGMSGLEVCKQVKSTSELSATFFILLTSLGSVDDRIKGLDAGSDDFLCKPIELNEFKARVRAGLRLYQLNQALQKQKKLLENELTEAANYVCSLLPEPLEEDAISIDFRFIPSFTLGGDCLDYFWLDSDHLVIYLLDVAGHGLKATLPSLSVINLLRYKGLNQVDYYQPKEVLNSLNKTFQMSQRNEKYFTIWYGIYNKTKKKVLNITSPYYHTSHTPHPPQALSLLASAHLTPLTSIQLHGLLTDNANSAHIIFVFFCSLAGRHECITDLRGLQVFSRLASGEVQKVGPRNRERLRMYYMDTEQNEVSDGFHRMEQIPCIRGYKRSGG